MTFVGLTKSTAASSLRECRMNSIENVVRPLLLWALPGRRREEGMGNFDGWLGRVGLALLLAVGVVDAHGEKENRGLS